MKRSLMLVPLFLCVLGITASNALAVTIDMDSLINTDQNPITEFFEAGDYLVTVIGTSEGGAYNAWNAWGGNTAGDTGWITNYSIASDQIPTIFIGSNGRYDTALEALENANDTSFSLLADGYVNFYIGDSYYLDNIGGVSLSVTSAAPPVPEPATVFLIGSGLLGFGISRRKRKK